MRNVPVRAFRTNLTDYAARAVAGDEFIVRRHGRAIALLRAPTEAEKVKEIQIHAVRAAMGRTLRQAQRGRRWLITYRGVGQVILTRPPTGVTPFTRDDQENER